MKIQKTTRSNKSDFSCGELVIGRIREMRKRENYKNLFTIIDKILIFPDFHTSTVSFSFFPPHKIHTIFVKGEVIFKNKETVYFFIKLYPNSYYPFDFSLGIKSQIVSIFGGLNSKIKKLDF